MAAPVAEQPAPQPQAVPSLPAAAEEEDRGEISPLLFWALAILVLAIAFVALFRLRRRPAAAPEFVAPVVPPQAENAALKLEVAALRMDRSLMNATVAYRITVRNPTGRALSKIAIEADLVSATREKELEGQLASPLSPLPVRHQVGRIAPGGSQRLEGQLRLPLANIAAIRQGNVALLVPLMRVRAVADEIDPVATTLVIGQGSGARPQPFRLDEPPRSFAPLAQRTLDSAALAV